MKLNVGCGDHRAVGWVNVDIEANEHVRPDVVADVRTLPFDLSKVRAVYLGHVLEHLAYDEAAELLVSLRRGLEPGTPVLVVGPDVRRAQAFGEETLRLARDGRGAWAHDVHQWACEELLLLRLMLAAEFTRVVAWPVHELPSFWPVVSRVGWQAAVGGRV